MLHVRIGTGLERNKFPANCPQFYRILVPQVGVLFKIPDEHPLPFYMGVSPCSSTKHPAPGEIAQYYGYSMKQYCSHIPVL